MNGIGDVVAKLRKEEKHLVRRLQSIRKALKAFRGLDHNGLDRGPKKHPKHDARSRKKIGRAKKKWWKERKKLLKAGPKKESA
jgi:hypothetical protein